MKNVDETRRRFMAYFGGLGLGSTLLPGVLWGQMRQSNVTTITPEMLKDALAVAGLDFNDEERTKIARSANQALTQYKQLHDVHVPNNISPPFHFNPIVPGMKVNRKSEPIRISPNPAVKRPANLEDVAFWPVRNLAELVRTKQVTSVELTTMYLTRLKRYNPKLNNVVTFC